MSAKVKLDIIKKTDLHKKNNKPALHLCFELTPLKFGRLFIVAFSFRQLQSTA